jgi:putative membrane protein
VTTQTKLPPTLLAPLPDAETRIDHGWAPPQVLPPRPPRGALPWLTGGVLVLLGTWLVTDLVGFAAAAFRDSSLAAGFTLAAIGAGLGMIATSVAIEGRSLLRLRHADALRADLTDPSVPLATTKRAAQRWLGTVAASVPDSDRIAEAISAAPSASALAATLQTSVAGPLRAKASAIGLRAAVEGGALVAVTPSQPLEGAIAAIRSLLLIRQIAGLYGVRPGPVVLWQLLRRVAWTAAAVAGSEVFVQSFTDHALSQLPGLRHLAQASGMSVAAFRLYRLALVTAEACSPLP